MLLPADDADDDDASRALSPAGHLAGGHRAPDDSGAGPALTDGRGRFYKLLPEGPRGDREVQFYLRGPGADAARGVAVPRCFGVITPQLGPGVPVRRYLVLEDITAGFHSPCVVDIKLGRRTWDGRIHNPAYAAKHQAKDAASTLPELGFKLSGMFLWRRGEGGELIAWRPPKLGLKALRSRTDVIAMLRVFAGESPPPSDHPVWAGYPLKTLPVGPGAARFAVAAATALAPAVAWASSAHGHVLCSCSALIAFDGEYSGSAPALEMSVRAKLVDFAHAFPAEDGGSTPPGDLLAGLLDVLADLN